MQAAYERSEREKELLEAKLLKETNRRLQAEVEADSHLNHTLKNLIAEAKSVLELLLEAAAATEDVDCNLSPEYVEAVKKAIENLYRAMNWCHRRQMFQQLQAGSYVARSIASSLSAWAAEISNIYNVVVRSASDCFLSVDWEVVELISHDGLTNAQKYGHPEKKPWIEVQVNDATSELVFSVCNVAHPKDPPITAEIAAKILHGGKGDSHASGIESVDESIRTSDGIGIANALKAAQAIKGQLRLRQETIDNELVTKFELRVPFERKIKPPATAASPTLMLSPAVDMPIEQRREQFHLAPLAPTTATCKTSLSLTTSLKCASVDDSATLLKTYQRMLHKKHLQAESVVIGSTHDEIDAAVDVIMGRKTQELVLVTGEQRPADIVTLDFNLGHRLNGTDIAATLHDEGFEGLVCIFSGGSEEDMAQYLNMPGVDMTISKATKHDAVAKMLLEQHGAKIRRQCKEMSSSQ